MLFTAHSEELDLDGPPSQEIYGKLEEPDGLGGLIRLRHGGPRLQDQILASEKAGSWNEALALHEQALQTNSMLTEQPPGLTAHQRGQLQCLLHMGHLQGMLAQVDGWSLTSDGGAPIYLKAQISFAEHCQNNCSGSERPTQCQGEQPQLS